MRLRVWIALTLLAVACAACALADAVQYGDTVYVFQSEAAQPAQAYVAVRGVRYDEASLAPTETPGLAGAVFGVYARSAQGGFVPFPDPKDPLIPYQVTSTGEATAITLPGIADLYLKQEAAPDGYAMDTISPAYQRLRDGETLTYTNRQTGRQGLVITLLGQGADSLAPLKDVVFSLEGADAAYTLTTDAEGVAVLTGMTPGVYTLRQASAPAGFQIDVPGMEIVIEDVPVHLSLTNSRDGQLSLRALGLSMDEAGNARLVPIARAYEVFDAGGDSLGFIASGEMRSLPASAEGTAYTLRAVDAEDSSFAVDAQTHAATLFPGQTTLVRTVVEDTRGTFSFQHLEAATGAPIAGGIFQLQNAAGDTVLTFEADAQGQFTPSVPLPAGTYTLRMAHTAEGHVYSDTAVLVYIASAFDAERETAVVTFLSTALPEALLSPAVRAQSASLPSLFDQDATIEFTLSAFSGDEPVTVRDVVYDFALPDIEGLTVLARRDDGARLRVARRVELDGVPEITALTVEGTVSYAFACAVDSAGGTQTVEVSAPFAVQVATFAPTARATPYVLSGHVYDENGAPVIGLRVTLGEMETITDPFGAYAFGAQPPEETPVFHVPEGFGVRMDGPDAWMLPLREVSGQVIVHGDLTGYPVTLTIDGQMPVAPGSDGSFVLTGPFAATDRLTVQTQQGVLASVDESGAFPVVHLYPAGSITGVAADPDGRPVAGVTIQLEGEAVAESGLTGTDGVFAFDDLLPGEYTLTFAPPQGHVLNEADSHSLSLTAGEQAQVHVSAMRAAAIEGSLMDGDMPYAGVRVVLLPTSRETVTDNAGGFAFEGLSVGTYTIVFDIQEDVVLLDAPGPVELSGPAQREAYTVHAVHPASLSGRIWFDENDDGYLSAGEGGQASVRIALFDELSIERAAVETDATGDFAFDGLVPGAYRLEVTLPENMIFSRAAPDTERIAVGVSERTAQSDWYTLESGRRLEGLTAGAVEAGVVHGVLWEDLDGNGRLDAVEARLPGIEIALEKDGATLAEAKTDLLGQYRFASLRPGDYTLRITLPEGCMFTAQAGSAAGLITSSVAARDSHVATQTVSLRRWRMDAVVNAGMQRPVAISAHVWQDTAAGGANPGGAGYAGVTVSLFRLSDTSEALIAWQATDENGNASFEGLRPGQFQLRYQLPDAASWGFTAGVAQTSGNAGLTDAFTLYSGATYAASDVGLTKYGRIEGVAFMDADYNGLRDAGESGLSVQVALLSASGAVLREAQTRSGGAYAFDRLPAGMYSVRFTLPGGYAFTRQRLDAPSYNSDVPEGGELAAQTDAIYLPMGETLLLDAGAYRKASLTGMVWQDARGAGRYSADNPPLEGVEVALLREGETVAQTRTGEDGAYRFSDIPPGTYAVRVTLPEGMWFTAPGRGTRPSQVPLTDDAAAQTHDIPVGNGEQRANVDIGAIMLGAVGGTAVDSLTGNALPGVTVTLDTGTTPVIVVTDADGQYLFGDIRPGGGTVSFEAPAGYALSPEDDGPAQVTIAQGGTTLQDVSCIPEAAIQGHVWLDADADGTPEGDEPLRDVPVTLYRTEGEEPVLFAVSATDAQGRYAFDKLLPGAYHPVVELPEDILFFDGQEPVLLALGMGETVSLDTAVYAAGSVSGHVWEDLNNDGLRTEDEPGMVESRVMLLRPDGTPVKETVTDEQGAYRFDALPPQPYVLRFTLPDGYLFTAPTPGGSIVPAQDAQTADTDAFSLAMGAVLTGLDAGALRHTRVGDLVWLDANGNGLQDTGEPGIAGVLVRLWALLDDEETFIAETITDADGRYRFDQLRPGVYYVAFETDEALWPTRPVEGLDQISSRLPWRTQQPLATAPFLAQSGRYRLDQDAGFVTTAMAEAFGWVVDAAGSIEEDHAGE